MHLGKILNKKMDGPIICFLYFCFQSPDVNRVKILRYTDPELGPRKVPKFQQFADGKTSIAANATFSISLDTKRVAVSENGKSADAGVALVYMVE